MSKIWYSYPSLLRKQSTSSLDCLDSFICAGALLYSSGIYYWPASNNRPALASWDWMIRYRLIPMANSNGVYIRGDDCNSQTGAFNDVYGFKNATGEYWITLYSCDYCPYDTLSSSTYRYPNRRECRWESNSAAYNNRNSGRFNFDFSTMTGTLDMRIDNSIWTAFIDQNTNNANAPAQWFPADYPNQSVGISDAQPSGLLGDVFSYTFAGSGDVAQSDSYPFQKYVYDDQGNLKCWSYEPTTNYFFKVPFVRS